MKIGNCAKYSVIWAYSLLTILFITFLSDVVFDLFHPSRYMSDFGGFVSGMVYGAIMIGPLLWCSFK